MSLASLGNFAEIILNQVVRQSIIDFVDKVAVQYSNKTKSVDLQFSLLNQLLSNLSIEDQLSLYSRGNHMP